MRIKNLLSLWIIVAFLLVSTANAIPARLPTTLGGENSNPSTNSPNDYIFCAGRYFGVDDNGLCAGFNNASLCRVTAGTASDFQLTQEALHYTSAGRSEHQRVTCSRPNTWIGNDTCMDIRIEVVAGVPVHSEQHFGYFLEYPLTDGNDDPTSLFGHSSVCGSGSEWFFLPKSTGVPAGECIDTNFKPQLATIYNITICQDDVGGKVNKSVFFNNTYDLLINVSKGDGATNFSFHIHDFGISGREYNITWVAVYNISGAPQAGGGGPDTTPPEILSFNLSTPSGDCTSWPSGTCSTGDTTPTVTITTDDNAFCAIGLVEKNFTHYDGLGVNRSCENGGTKSHICTLRTDDELVYEDSTIYIGCRNTEGYENSTSTSGALSLTITGLESGGDTAIGVGIQNALLSGYTNYTHQQIYARNLAGQQDYGTFDWVAKKGSKVWAFNYISKGEIHVGLFNMTPVLYVLEMANITNATITNTVETMINATK